jgi:type I restriction enzyme S subunit
VLELRRRPVNVELDAEYDEIGVRSFGRGIFHKEPVSGADLGKKRVFFVEPGDLVVSNVFAWEGAIGVASDHDAGRIGSHRFMTFVPKDGRIDTSWAAWFFLSEPGLELVRAASPGSAGRNRTLAIDRFEAVEIPLPPIEEQHSVAHELDHVASCTDNLRILSKRASDLTTALVVSLATRPDLHNGQKRETGWSDLRLGVVSDSPQAEGW